MLGTYKSATQPKLHRYSIVWYIKENYKPKSIYEDKRFELLNKFKQIVEIDVNLIADQEEIQFIQNCISIYCGSGSGSRVSR